jgi:hypothetical protein
MMPPDHEQIRRRAYEIWEREGRPEGRESEHWRLAAEEISAAHATTGTQEVPATRVRGPAQLEQEAPQPSGAGASLSDASPAESGNVPAAPSPDPQSDPLGLAQPIAQPVPRKRAPNRNARTRTRQTNASPPDADAKAPDRSR